MEQQTFYLNINENQKYDTVGYVRLNYDKDSNIKEIKQNIENVLICHNYGKDACIIQISENEKNIEVDVNVFLNRPSKNSSEFLEQVEYDMGEIGYNTFSNAASSGSTISFPTKLSINEIMNSFNTIDENKIEQDSLTSHIEKQKLIGLCTQKITEIILAPEIKKNELKKELHEKFSDDIISLIDEKMILDNLKSLETNKNIIITNETLKNI